MKFSVAHPNTGKRSTEKIHQFFFFHDSFGSEKRENNFTSALLQGSCSEVIFRGPPKIPFETSITWTFLRLFLPREVIFALRGKRSKITRDDA